MFILSISKEKMGRISLAVCLVLLVALSNVYETQAQAQGKTFSVLDYLALFPKTGKEFAPYAFKGLLDFVGALEGKSPTTVEFKNFFTNLKGYITSCFQPAPPGSVKSDQLFTAISALKGSQTGTSVSFHVLKFGFGGHPCRRQIDNKRNEFSRYSFKKNKIKSF